jgi:hypothetical protein
MPRSSPRIQQQQPQPSFTGLGQLSQPPLLQWCHGYWQLWLAYNRARTAGTFLVLSPDGSITRMTEQPTGELVNVVTIKP